MILFKRLCWTLSIALSGINCLKWYQLPLVVSIALGGINCLWWYQLPLVVSVALGGISCPWWYQLPVRGTFIRLALRVTLFVTLNHSPYRLPF